MATRFLTSPQAAVGVTSAIGHDGISGIPGTVTDVSLTFTHGLTFERWSDSLELLGHIGGGIQWWVADAINWGAQMFGERFSQGLDRFGTVYATQTLLNISYVGRAIPPARRRGLPLTFSHHATVAFLTADAQETWLTRATAGDPMPNGEKKPWSVSRLRAALRAQTPKTPKARQPSQEDELRAPARVIVGTLLDVEGSGLCKVVGIYPKDAGILVQCVRLS